MTIARAQPVELAIFGIYLAPTALSIISAPRAEDIVLVITRMGRDIGLDYAAGLLFIYLLVVAQVRSYAVPLIIMAPISLTIIGVMPGHALLGAQFTATSMVRTALLAGIFCFGVPAVFAGDINMGTTPSQALPTESGQSAFAVIHEIVGMLEADPKTDWSKVNIDALRQHLIDMDNVTLHAKITYEAIPNGNPIRVSGDSEVRQSIQRMVMMHVAMAGDTPDWHMDGANAPDGGVVSMTAKSRRAFKGSRRSDSSE